MQVFIACGLGESSRQAADAFRKPKPGMWHIMEKHFNSGISIDMDQLIFLPFNYFYMVSIPGILNIEQIFSAILFILLSKLIRILVLITFKKNLCIVDPSTLVTQLGDPTITVMLILNLHR